MHPISVCIIAKNEESRIEKCLMSIKPCEFEIIVVDTGSTDKTKEIAAKYADKVLDFVWCDDFSAARNFSLQAASNNWIFMMDCDEWIKTIDIEELNFFRKHHADSVGAISRENLVTTNGKLTLNNTDYTERFFNRKLYHYTGIIHEQLTPIRGKEFPCLLLHTTIEHTGYDMTPEEQIAKGKRNLSLLHKQLEEDAENPYVYYQLGKGYEIVEDYESACEYYGKGLYFDVDPELAYVQAMVVSYGNALLRTGQKETALGFESIYDAFSSSADFVYLMGRIYMANEQYPQAVEQFLKATTMERSKYHGANSFLSFYHIGLIFEKLGDTVNANAYYRKCGDFPPALEKLSRKRIAIFEGGNFILKYITGQYRKAFERMGCDTFLYPEDIHTQENFQKSTEQLFHFHEQGLDFAFTMNNRGFSWQTTDGISLWDNWKVPCLNLLVDHPVYYFDSLDESPEYGVVLCADRNHQDYIKRFYPRVHKTIFLPTAGVEFNSGMPKNPIQERAIDVLFIGSLKLISDDSFDDLDRQTINYLLNHSEQTYEQALETCLLASDVHLPDSELKQVMQEHRHVDIYISAFYRMEIIRHLVEAGITVTVYGDGWESVEFYNNPHFVCHPGSIPFEEGLALMEESKIVLNQMSWFKDGATERVFNAMLQGAVSLTDDSVYLREVLANGKNVIFYSLKKLDELSPLVLDLLQNPDKMQEISNCGYQTALSAHTWEHRAIQLMDAMERLGY